MNAPKKRYRLAILQRHPIQYHSPIFREIARSEEIDLTVLFLDNAGMKSYFDRTMNAVIKWDVPLLKGFRHEFLANWSPCKKRKLFLNRFNPQILWRLRRGRYDGVLIQGYDTASNLLALLIARLRGLDIIFRGEVVLLPGQTSSGKNYFKSRIIRMFLRNSNAVLFTCKGNKRFFQHYGCQDSKLYSFPCAVDNAYFRMRRVQLRESGNNLRKELGIEEKTLVALMAGRMDINKSQRDLLKAVGRLQAKALDIATVFVGDGPERTHLESLVKKEKVQQAYFVGFKNQSEISAYYDMADVFCLCSKADRSPKVINEALNFELPIISSDRPGTLGDSILEGENALVYEYGNVQALADCLEKLILEPERRREMGKRSIELSDELSLQADVAGLERAVRDLQASRRLQ